MSEEISYELYKWLSSLNVVSPNLRYKPNGNYELDHKTTQGLLNGYLITNLLVSLARTHDAVVNQPLLSSIKQSSTPAARMYNWNILSESFLKINVTVGKSSQKQITSGNFKSLVRFLLDLHKRFNPKKNEKREEQAEPELNLKKLQVTESFEQAQTLLELVILIISKELSLTPKQVVSTLSQNAKYYAHMVVKGIKNSFEEILNMIDTFSQQLPQLMYLSEKDPEKNTEFLLDLIKPTLISRQTDVAKNGAKLFAKFVDQSLKYNSKNIIYQILCKDQVGFDFLYMALKRHPELSQDFTTFLFPLTRHALQDFFEVHLRRTINNKQEYLKILLRLVEGFSALPDSHSAIQQSGMLDSWLKNCEESFEGKLNKEEQLVNEETKILYLQLLCNLWKQYSKEIDQEHAQNLLVKGINELKKNTRKDIYTVKIPALLRLFDFLHFLANTKNPMASVAYKKLIFLMIENHEETEVRQIILDNFSIVLRKYPTIPIDFLLEPLLKQLISSEGKTYILNIFDYEFMIEVCRHPKMHAQLALSYLQYFSKLYIKSFIYAKLTIRVVSILTSRFCQEETIIEFIKKTVQITLNQYGILVFNKKKSSREQKIINKQRMSLSIELLKHFIQLQHQELKEFILNRVLGLYLQWLENKKHHNKGLKYLVQLFGDFEELTIQYKIEHNPYSRETPSQSLELDSSRPSKPTPKSQAYRQQQYMREKGIGYRQKSRPHKTHADSLLEASSFKPAPNAIQQLQKIKQKMREGANRKRQKEDNQLKRLKEKNNLNSMQLLQRNLSLGYAKISPQMDGQVIFQFGSVKPKQLKISTHFYSLEQLQTVDKDSSKTILKTYAKDLKSLFLKYALMSSPNQSFRKEELVTIMSFTEVIKMLNEKGVGIINKLIVGDLIASINQSKKKEKNILYGIQETDFNEFLLKLTDYLVQQEQSTPEVPLGIRLEKLIKSLLTNELFYENRFRVKQDQKIVQLREQVRKGQQNEFDLPEGYKKVRENQVQLLYSINNDDWGISSGYRVAYEVSDWLINLALGIHVVSPQVNIRQGYNLIQIPKTFKLPKHTSQDRISDAPETKQDLPTKSPAPQKNIRIGNQRRSQSQRMIHKTKNESVKHIQEDKDKKAKRQKYVEQMRQNLQKLKEEKRKKQEEQKKQELRKGEQQKQKQKKRKAYIQSNKAKVRHHKQKQEEEEKKKQNEQKRLKEMALEELKKREKNLLNKHQEQIEQFAQKRNEKKQNKLSHSKDAKTSKSPPAMTPTPAFQNDRVKMLEVKNSLDNGSLQEVKSQYDKQLNELMQAYWVWDQKRIDLKSIALLLKDFKVSPEFILPKTLSDTFKSVGKGQPLDFNGFVECLAKCAYRSPKVLKESEVQEGQQINVQIFKWLLTKLKMGEWNYKQTIHTVKNHLQ